MQGLACGNHSCYCAADRYALVSGYVGYGSQHGRSSLWVLCLQATFYTLVLSAAFVPLVPGPAGLKGAAKVLLPVPFGTHWCLTAYFCLFFVALWIDRAVAVLPRKDARRLLFAVLLVTSVFPTLLHRDITKTAGGYSFLWLAALYLLGAELRRFGLPVLGRARCLVMYGACVLVTWVSKLAIESITVGLLGSPKGGSYLLASFFVGGNALVALGGERLAGRLYLNVDAAFNLLFEEGHKVYVFNASILPHKVVALIVFSPSHALLPRSAEVR